MTISFIIGLIIIFAAILFGILLLMLVAMHIFFGEDYIVFLYESEE